MKQKTNSIFVDTNVFIGAYIKKKDDENCLNYLLSLKDRTLCVSSLTIAQIASILKYKKDKEFEKTKRFLKTIVERFKVITFDRNDIKNALLLPNHDLEDNMQYVMGRKVGCFFFITNNKKDYTRFIDITVLSPSRIRNAFSGVIY